MDPCMKKVYDMMYTPIISPYNLLENAKISNYNYVKYYNSDEGLIAEMECIVPDGELRVFYYHFDRNDFLQKIFVSNGKRKELIFERQKAIDEAILEYHESKPDHKQAI